MCHAACLSAARERLRDPPAIQSAARGAACSHDPTIACACHHSQSQRTSRTQQRRRITMESRPPSRTAASDSIAPRRWPARASAVTKVKTMLLEHPGSTLADLVTGTGLSERHVRRVIDELDSLVRAERKGQRGHKRWYLLSADAVSNYGDAVKEPKSTTVVRTRSTTNRTKRPNPRSDTDNPKE